MAKKTLAELRADTAPAPRPTAVITVTLTEGQHVLAEVKRIQNEITDVLATAATPVDDNGERTGAPRKAGQGGTAKKVEELRAQGRAAYAQLADHQHEVTMTGIPAGDWHRWKEEHPPREGSVLDRELALGWCNASDLLDELGSYVTSWDGETLPDGVWDESLAEKVTYADRRDMVTEVVRMYEQGINRVPFSSSGSSTTESSETA